MANSPAALTFHRDAHGGPAFTAQDDTYSALGSMLTGDIQNVQTWAETLLAYIDDVESGRSEHESWQGNSWEVEITKSGVHLQDLYSDDWTGTHTLKEARTALQDYLSFLNRAP
ncbi:hypothetical protein Asi02nite_79570 [Asanoa siamensis]|uniref:Uncharacterized protein n=1 Tax=Asanoa siamensis TaxID=926357 RepID=A0ABQ4D4H2_9ACTN|nr:hypothetical protein Asi02nite_79570 [Asanoa siamensis]